MTKDDLSPEKELELRVQLAIALLNTGYLRLTDGGAVCSPDGVGHELAKISKEILNGIIDEIRDERELRKAGA